MEDTKVKSFELEIKNIISERIIHQRQLTADQKLQKKTSVDLKVYKQKISKIKHKAIKEEKKMIYQGPVRKYQVVFYDVKEAGV